MGKRTFSFSADEEVIKQLLLVYNKKELHDLLNEHLEFMVGKLDYIKKKRGKLMEQVTKIDNFFEKLAKADSQITPEIKKLLHKYHNMEKNEGVTTSGLFSSFKTNTGIKCDFDIYVHLLHKYG